MDIYTPTTFRRMQAQLLHQVAATNEPLTITLKNTQGPNQNVVLITQDQYDRFVRSQLERT